MLVIYVSSFIAVRAYVSFTFIHIYDVDLLDTLVCEFRNKVQVLHAYNSDTHQYVSVCSRMCVDDVHESYLA